MSYIEARFKVNRPGFCLDVDLKFPSTGVTAIFGQSGSGKTTLLRCLAGLERPDEGRMVVDGVVWQDDKIWVPTYRRPIGYVFQEAGLFPHLTVLGNLHYGLKRVSKRTHTGLNKAVELLGIGHLLDRDITNLSTGERQRVAIALALSVEPRFLLMDEPLSALDEARKQEIIPYLKKLHNEWKIPMIYVSHSPDEVVRMADHLVLMENGRVTAQGPLGDLLTRPHLPVKFSDDYCVILEGTVVEFDEESDLAKIDFDRGSLWVPNEFSKIGEPARVNIHAKDVSIATKKPVGTSIQNIVPGRIDGFLDDSKIGSIVVRISVGNGVIMSRITRRSWMELGLEEGMGIWAQIKTAALIN